MKPFARFTPKLAAFFATYTVISHIFSPDFLGYQHILQNRRRHTVKQEICIQGPAGTQHYSRSPPTFDTKASTESGFSISQDDLGKTKSWAAYLGLVLTNTDQDKRPR